MVKVEELFNLFEEFFWGEKLCSGEVDKSVTGDVSVWSLSRSAVNDKCPAMSDQTRAQEGRLLIVPELTLHFSGARFVYILFQARQH